MIEKIILPLQIGKINHTPPVSLLYSILSINPASHSWLLNNFINIYSQKYCVFDNFYDRNMLFHGNPFLNVVQLPREVIDDMDENIHDFIYSMLKNGFYIYIAVNTQHINSYGLNNYRMHNLTIYGADFQRRIYYISDFFHGGKYECSTCSFDEFELAYKTADMNSGIINYVYGMKLKNIQFVFDIKHVITQLEEYVGSINLFNKYKVWQEEEYYSKVDDNFVFWTPSQIQERYFFGIQVYDMLVQSIEHQVHLNYMIRPIQLLCDHKKIMKDRLKYLFQNDFINDSDYLTLNEMLLELIRKLEIIKNTYLKYYLSLKNEIIQSLHDHILHVKREDLLFHNFLLEVLKRNAIE